MVSRRDISKTKYVWIMLQNICMKKKNNYIKENKHNEFLKIKIIFQINKITKIAKPQTSTVEI